jgi:hypothetical protein
MSWTIRWDFTGFGGWDAVSISDPVRGARVTVLSNRRFSGFLSGETASVPSPAPIVNAATPAANTLSDPMGALDLASFAALLSDLGGAGPDAVEAGVGVDLID